MKESDALADIRSVRDELARRFGNARVLSQTLTEQSRAAGRIVVKLPRRQPQFFPVASRSPHLRQVMGSDCDQMKTDRLDQARETDSQTQ